MSHFAGAIDHGLTDSVAVDAEPGDGVLLIGHGTRDCVGTRQFFELGKRLADRLTPLPVESCLLELQEPTIEQGWNRLCERGVRRVLTCPLLLFAAGHARSDIPKAISRCLDRWPSMTWREARPLSRAPELLRLALKRLDESLAQSTSSPNEVAVLMVGRGSFDPCAQTDMKLVTHWITGQRTFGLADTAFYAMAHPKLPRVLQRLINMPPIRTVIVQPHLLFEGSLYQSIIQQTQQIAGQYPDKEIIVSRYLGPESEVVDALLRRLTYSLSITSQCPRIAAST